MLHYQNKVNNFSDFWGLLKFPRELFFIFLQLLNKLDIESISDPFGGNSKPAFGKQFHDLRLFHKIFRRGKIQLERIFIFCSVTEIFQRGKESGVDRTHKGTAIRFQNISSNIFLDLPFTEPAGSGTGCSLSQNKESIKFVDIFQKCLIFSGRIAGGGKNLDLGISGNYTGTIGNDFPERGKDISSYLLIFKILIADPCDNERDTEFFQKSCPVAQSIMFEKIKP